MQHTDTILGRNAVIGTRMDIDAGHVNMNIGTGIEAGEIKRLCGSKILYDGFDW